MYVTLAGHRFGYVRDDSCNGVFEQMLKDGLYDMMDEYANEA